jgi:hypothetical protein
MDVYITIVIESAADWERGWSDDTPIAQDAQAKVGLADANATSVEAGISENPVVGDLEVVRPAVHEDAASGVTARDAEAVD